MTVADGELSCEVSATLAGLGSLEFSADGEFSCIVGARLTVIVPVSGAGEFSCEVGATLAGIVPDLPDGFFRGAGPVCTYTGWGGC